MVDYNITLHFNNRDVAQLNQNGSKVCFAIGVAGSGDPFTVIAFSDVINSQVRISWSDEYWMAATKDRHTRGIRFSVGVEPSSIHSKQKFTLPGDWTSGRVEDDGSLGDGSFSFVNNDRREVSAVLFQKVQGRSTPVYISGGSVGPGSTQSFSPQNEIAVWVDRFAETGTVISRNSGSQATFSMAGKTNMEAEWSGSNFVAK